MTDPPSLIVPLVLAAIVGGAVGLVVGWSWGWPLTLLAVSGAAALGGVAGFGLLRVV